MYLNFTSFTTPAYLFPGETPHNGTGSYSTSDEQAILAGLESIYSAFDQPNSPDGQLVQFTLTPPTAAEAPNGYETVMFDDTPFVNGAYQAGGYSDLIDFPGQAYNTTVFVDVNDFLGDPAQGLVADTGNNFVNLSIAVAAHETGHTLGFQHQDAFGPIGFGTTQLPRGAATTRTIRVRWRHSRHTTT